MQRIRTIIISSSMVFGFMFAFATINSSLVFAVDPAPATGTPSVTATYNPIPTDACQSNGDPNNDPANNPACTASSENPITGPNGIIMIIANLIAWFAGAIAVIMIIFAGFRLVKSSGDSSKVTVARETIIYSLVGLVVIVLARFIVAFVISKT